MTEHSATSQDSTDYGWQNPPLAATAVSVGAVEIRAARNKQCPACGEHVHAHVRSLNGGQNADVCPACGENLHHAPKPINCMHCHTTASSELVLCPGCGRELREAPPKLLTLGAPVVLALLLVVLLATQWSRVSPLAWARNNLARGVVLVEGISASIEPEMVIVMTPIVLEEGVSAQGSTLALAAPAESIIVSDTQAIAMAQSAITPLPDPNVSENLEREVLAASVIAPPPSGVGGPQPDASDVAATDMSAVSIAAETSPTETPLPTATPLPTETPLPPTATSTVKSTTEQSNSAGGLAASLAAGEATRTPTPTWTAVAASGGTAARTGATSPTSEAVGGVAQVAALSADDAELPTATATATVVLTPLPTPTATPVVYQVRAGDTLVTIAAAYEVDVEALMAANQINAQQVFAIQPGQMLIVPVPTPEAVVATSNLSAMRLSTPELLMPPADVTIGCATGGTLMWQRVQFIKDSDKYVLHLGFVNGRDATGQESVAWVVAQNSPVTTTEWELDRSLCELAPAEFGRQWRWWVEVLGESDGEVISVSPPSEIRGFVWQ